MPEQSEQRLIYNGKTKTVYAESGSDDIIIAFKDNVTGWPDGTPDPGGNFIVGTIPGSGKKNLTITMAFFTLLRQAGIATPIIQQLDEWQIRVEALKLIPLEVICRNQATGSFVRRYGEFVQEGQPLDGLIEFTLKDDLLGDPLITEEAVRKLSIIDAAEIEQIKRTVRQVNSVMQCFLAPLGIELWDFKLEFGRRPNGELVVRDEICPPYGAFSP
ncbi:MAG: phosphoribosylaminoimidazolesuccinocarboxamide synthase, partial [Chloroflexi bacterium]|nr:phosphoribosylaminoimidazolesuccinocarboxamide synthase [Chloroflexota bacterium]